jgi:hypothetical protein
MFVHWQVRRRQGAKYGRADTTKLRAVLVESVRVGGQPRQRHLAYLGVIDAARIDITLNRIWFWDAVTDRLDRLGNRLPGEVRQRIEAAMAKRVPPPTPDERVTVARNSAEADSRLAAEFKELRRARLRSNMKRPAPADKWRCSFCGNNEKEFLVAGAAAFICDECVEAAVKLIAERKATPA